MRRGEDTNTGGMALVPGGAFAMGTENFYPEEAPVRTVTVAPFWLDLHPVTNAQFAKTLGSVLHRPSLVPVPAFGPKLLLGSELADALLFTGQKVLPKVLQRSGYRFQHATLEDALRAAVG